MKYLKIFMAVLLLCCLLRMPYGYYRFIRMFSMLAFALMSYKYFMEKRWLFMTLFGGLALLFQPFLKVLLGRTVWNIVDVIVAILLIGLWIKERREK